MSAEVEPDPHVKIAHVLFMDIVGYSKRPLEDQAKTVARLNEVVRNCAQVRQAEVEGKLIRLPTGDGMALVFFTNPETPVLCGVEISKLSKNLSNLELRMGIHSGPVNEVPDVNEKSNIAGSGINIAQRVMDCADAGHILLSKHVADDMADYQQWRPHLRDLGECEVKHGTKLHLFNLASDKFGNPSIPAKVIASTRAHKRAHRLRITSVPAFIALVVLGCAAWWWVRADRLTASVAAKSIAVLPFESLSTEAENAFFAEGVQDEILNHLAKIADLKVISRTSVMQYKAGAPRNLREIAKALGVAHVIEGTVQRAADTVHVSAQLIDARNDTHVWSESYNRPLGDVFAIQSEIAKAVTDQLKVKLSSVERTAIEQQPTTDLIAYDRYARARAILSESWLVNAAAGSSSGRIEAARLLNEAVSRDPKFFIAWCLLSYAHDLIYSGNVDHTPARLALADDAIKKAMELRPDGGEAHFARARHFYFSLKDYDGAREELATARRALPNDPYVLQLLGWIDSRQGHWRQYLQDMQRALELDPRNVSMLRAVAEDYSFLRRYKEYRDTFDRALAIAPSDASTRVARALVDLDWHADTRPAHETIHDVLSQDPTAAGAIAANWWYLALCERDRAEAYRALMALPSAGIFHGEPRTALEAQTAWIFGDLAVARSKALAILPELETQASSEPENNGVFVTLGYIDAVLGRKEEAIGRLRRALELLPIEKNPIGGAQLLIIEAAVYCRLGENETALEYLKRATSVPSTITYGWLRLHPWWDPLRSDSRFEKIVAESQQPVAIK